MFLKKVIPCLLVVLAGSAMSGCVIADGEHHRGPSSSWHRHHHASQDQRYDNSWHQHAGPAAPADDASQHMGPPPAPGSAAQHLGPPPAPGSAAQHMGPPSDSGIQRWQP